MTRRSYQILCLQSYVRQVRKENQKDTQPNHYKTYLTLLIKCNIVYFMKTLNMEALLIALMTIAALLVKVRYLKNRIKFFIKVYIKILKFISNRINLNLKYDL